MDRKYLLVGDAPTDAEGLDPAGWICPDGGTLPGRANGVLNMTGLDLEEFLGLFERTHVIDWIPDEGRPFSPSAARQRAAALTKDLAGGPLRELEGVLVLGRRAANAFNWWGERYDGALGRISSAELEDFAWRSISTGGSQGSRTRVAAALLPYPANLGGQELERARAFFARLAG
jgi:hypothetical protein